jgi:large subunit ribosomal protein L4
MKVDVYNTKNEVTGTTELPDVIFGARWRPALVQQVLVAFRANQRRPWAHAKGRGEVRGGGKKPWRQKGTGRARHGSIRSPLWVGGGKAHGPQKERDYTQKINRKMNRGALFSVLSRKLREQEVKIIECFRVPPKTKALASVLNAVAPRAATQKPFDALLIPSMEEKSMFRAAANLPKVKAVHPASLNVYDAVNYKRLLIDKDAVTELARHFTRP